MSSKQSVLLPTETLNLESGLSLVPRLKLNLSVHRADASVKPLDEWQLKTSLIDFLKSSFSISVPEDDLILGKLKDLKKRKREDPVARGTLFVRELGFLVDKVEPEEVEVVEKKVCEWKKKVVGKLDGIELSLVGVRFKLSVEVPKSDDFEVMRKEWEEVEEEVSAFDAGRHRGYARGRKREPDTIVLRGVPSRWFAETRVSSKPSMLVTHTIFSALGKIRNLDVAEDDGSDKDADEDIVRGLQCKIVVRFEDHREFSKALKVLCGRSLEKQGSRLKADYEVSWDKDGIFRNARSQNEENSRSTPKVAAYNDRSEPARHQSHAPYFSENHIRSKRFKE
ncbi:hypothetical protein HanRHA438_Chr08g0370351 [Helianthus annuus]|uniref:Putative ZCW7 n=1 Tax=Helianthus annuus TaxID=4232 RepID=A0A251U8D5_HELAN|nr:A-kinase anchor protein 17B isoform X1 [Helianthus annuus]KAF5796985.1 hypothetical protein HanXRQr2_Chr08g0358261 [Helianthus annuus]KAJ0540226.1 hypothetical protein HanHA300_Chr08g0295801 [Helianthus annuus]KAJ0548705.1 hypothetical protein HanIR_Chr08g0386771 [Helianthus annuus]KAJ0554970.1 hypothetical protein HanHA89_Chr08g0314311 [Helianthus annuus]KAJ0720538.1 hypothetical protein HanLR1_Chr08g0294671 [Helianthus annuus]